MSELSCCWIAPSRAPSTLSSANSAGVSPIELSVSAVRVCEARHSRKKSWPANSATPTGQIDEIVLLLGVADVAASKRFYVDRGLEVARSFGRKYVQFATAHVKLALYRRRALAFSV
jgi:hypothetical protein